MQSEKKTLLSIVVPLFNEESNVESLYAELKQIEQRLRPVDVEMILVDDCSLDQTASLVRDLCREHDNIRFIRFAENAGSHAAIMAGISASKGDCVMFLAGDLQDPPALIPQMLDLWRDGNDTIWAVRAETIAATSAQFGNQTVAKKDKKKDSFFSWAYWRMVHYLYRYPMPKNGVDCFLIDRRVADVVAYKAHRRVPVFLVVASAASNTTIVGYAKRSRAGGKSGWTLKKKLGLIWDSMLFGVTEWCTPVGGNPKHPRFIVAERVNFSTASRNAQPTKAACLASSP